jgi:hypothetical protein
MGSRGAGGLGVKFALEFIPFVYVLFPYSPALLLSYRM